MSTVQQCFLNVFHLLHVRTAFYIKIHCIGSYKYKNQSNSFGWNIYPYYAWQSKNKVNYQRWFYEHLIKQIENVEIEDTETNFNTMNKNQKNSSQNLFYLFHDWLIGFHTQCKKCGIT